MRRVVLVQLILFALTAAVVVPFGIAYVVGSRAFGDPIRLHASMSDALGLTVGTSVTYRGVHVGRVASVGLDGKRSGARVEFDLDAGTRIPRDSIAKVAMSTAAGIQSVDIYPATDSGPYLEDGDTLAAPQDRQPVQMEQLMGDTAKLLGGIDPATVTALGTELGASLDGLGPSLASMIDDGDKLSALLERQAPQLRSLLTRTASLVGTMADGADSFGRGMAAARTFTGQLDDNSPVLVYLLDRSPDALAHTQELFDRYHDTFGALLANLATVTPIISDRRNALAAGLDEIPEGLGKLESIVRGDRAEFALVGTQGPVCNYDTPRRAVGDTGRLAVGDPSPTQPNLTLYCPPGPNIEQRGSRTAPRPNDLGLQNASTPGTVIGPPMVPDPVLVPTGAEMLDQWNQLLEELGDGER
ncbi:MlaD family protein [Prescottella agglutinans]|uniref:Phospholipid/cholesterol/gamma-HCH transport system substrate-binding protein n=1 Tax=Prescottella agglutinans TaxID=1644129 RepID=A0ABT6MDP2_9NOCA|nr:MlaD family protein [Prescottella agglutinans]MDH6282437.1 phospholipid/cholesterol/gamma-HCH transport system substrate-binding protein [Prescottella agglutinans]